MEEIYRLGGVTGAIASDFDNLLIPSFGRAFADDLVGEAIGVQHRAFTVTAALSSEV